MQTIRKTVTRRVFNRTKGWEDVELRIELVVDDPLVKALEARGYNVRIDRSDIRKGEEWWKRIVDLIVDSMLVVFVISPDSAGSPVCRDEVALTKRLEQRIVPLLWRSAARAQIPEGLAERNWVSFEPVDPSGYAQLKRELVRVGS